jgi:hypothetical protein
LVNPTVLILALLAQVTPPPPPPVLATPVPSPSASATPLASPQPSPGASPTAAPAPLGAAPAAVNLHPAQSQLVTVSGATGVITTQLDTPLVTATVDQNARTVTVTAAQQTGRATLTIADSNGASVTLPVRVALDAGSVPPSITLRVTGNSLDPAWLQRQVSSAVLRATQTQPGAGAPQIGAFTLPTLFAPGSTAAIPVQVSIAGGDSYFDVTAPATVNLQNVDAGTFLPPLLFYDDDPEKIVANGVLYRSQVTSATPARLYYYHQNAGDPRRLAVVLSTSAQDPATVQLIDSSAGPNIDVMTVGHTVTRDFLTAKPRNQGIVVDVGPQAPYVADTFALKPLDGAAGSVGIRLLSGSAVNVTVVAVPAETTDAQLAEYLGQPRLPGDGHHRTGIFALNGYGAQTLAYTAGGPDASIQYGVQTPPSADPGAGHDYGEYGVLRTLTFDVDNPAAQPATVYLYERPMGGVVRSSFLVDGQLVQVGCARLSERYQIGEAFALQPGAKYQVTVQTMTDGGSNYPLEVGMTATPPLPATPAITAPDGCFPKPQTAPAPAASPGSTGTPAPGAIPAPEPTGRPL